MTARVLQIVFLVAAVSAEGEIVSDCPSPNGYFADAVQCDKYYACTDGVIEEKLCPDGMAFNDLNPTVEKCDFLFQIDCKERPQLQPAESTEDCPRANGYFPHPVPTNCGEFFYCSTGIGSKVTCPEGLMFSLKTGTCVWPAEAGRVDCVVKKEHNFTCPKVSQDIAVGHPRYADPVDCQYFFVCINGKDPRRNGCAFGSVFNTNTTACDKPKNVLDCKEYYFPYFDEYFSTLGTGNVASRAANSIIAAAQDSGYEVPGNSIKIRPKQRISPGNKGRKPIDPNAPVPEKEVLDREETAPPVDLPKRKRPQRRRRPQGFRTTTTTTTTEAPGPDDYYYYDYDYPTETTAGPAGASATP